MVTLPPLEHDSNKMENKNNKKIFFHFFKKVVFVFNHVKNILLVLFAEKNFVFWESLTKNHLKERGDFQIISLIRLIYCSKLSRKKFSVHSSDVF